MSERQLKRYGYQRAPDPSIETFPDLGPSLYTYHANLYTTCSNH